MVETELFQQEYELGLSPEHAEAAPELEPHAQDLETRYAQSLIAEKKGGRAEDWNLEYSGTDRYVFDGTEVKNLMTGESWTKEIEATMSPDAIAAHHEMLAQWREGGDMSFMLPDYRERVADGEMLYVTHLHLGENGEVTYEIWSTLIPESGSDDANDPSPETSYGRAPEQWIDFDPNAPETPSEHRAETEETERAEWLEELLRTDTDATAGIERLHQTSAHIQTTPVVQAASPADTHSLGGIRIRKIAAK